MTNTFHQDITNKIITAIENGTAKFQMPWINNAGLPVRAATGENYRGINILNLWIDQQLSGFSSNLWGGFGYWKSQGGCIRKGSKSSMVIHFSIKEKVDRQTGEIEEIPFTRTFRVFNRDQIEGLPEEPICNETLLNTPTTGEQTNTSCTDTLLRIAEDLNAVVTIGGTRACYSPSLDEIRMPDQHLFFDRPNISADTAFASTLGHELIHWTGHPTRLDRDLSGSRKSDRENYAKEELIAELGASFLCAELGFDYSGVEDHAGYIESWLKVLKSDNTAIFTAAAVASKAVSRILCSDKQVVKEKI